MAVEKCKVIGCNNRAMKRLNENAINKNMKNVAQFGYCQIHQIEGLVTENIGEKKQ